MTATIQVTSFPGFTWTVIAGDRRPVFTLLGEHARDDIADVIAKMVELQDLRDRCETDARLRDHLAAVTDASRREYPLAWSELEAMAGGSGVRLDDIVLLNLRGDLGPMAGSPATAEGGCSSIGWSDRSRALLAHNEDGSPTLFGRCRLLTLRITDEPSVTVWWYPGFLPANTFALNSAGVGCAVDNINAVRPAVAPGRHFIARAVHRCTDIEEAVELLTSRASAGGFAYTLGQTGRTDLRVVEAVGGESRSVSCPADTGAFTAHQNHLRFFDLAGVDAPDGESLERESIFARTAAPKAPDGDWLLRLLRADKPIGVRRHGVDGDLLMTLATFVVDLTSAQVTIAPRGADPLNFPADALATGAPATDPRTL